MRSGQTSAKQVGALELKRQAREERLDGRVESLMPHDAATVRSPTVDTRAGTE